jgi:Rhs element Vgr protein
MGELFVPNPSQHDVSSFQVLVEGKQIDPSYQVISISVSREVNRIPTAKIIIRDGEAAERDFEISNSDDFLPGKKIRIKIGLDGNNNQAFEGIIVKHAIKISTNGNSMLQVECFDAAVRMSVGRHSRYYTQVSDSRLFDEIISQYSGLSVDAESTSLTHKEIVQHHISDWDFILLRAEANGMLVRVEDGKLGITKPNTSAKPVLQLTYGSSIIEFEAEMDARTQWKNVKASSWDFSKQGLMTADTTEATSFTQSGNVQGSDIANAINLSEYEMRHSGHLPEQELQDWADGIMMRSRLSKIRGRARFAGFDGIRPGDMVKLDGVGNRFTGNAYVTAVRQEIGNGSWETHVQFGLDSMRYAFLYNDMQDQLSAGLVGGIHGLQIGIVVQLENDPDGEDRIKVKIPLIDNQSQGTWMRASSLDAGSDRGAFFRPEIGDEVIVGFINGDPREGIVLGMLHSSAKPAPISAKDVNHEKGFTTRSKMHLSFNDDTKTIVIDTPAGNKITMDEQGKKIEIKDQNENKITMDMSGIKLESQKNIDIKAGVNLSLAAGATLSIGGLSLGVKADGNLTLEGAMAKLSASGIAEISGSMVKIN